MLLPTGVAGLDHPAPAVQKSPAVSPVVSPAGSVSGPKKAAAIPLARGDVAVTALAGTDGVGVLRADSSSSGGWRLLTTLRVAGWDAPSWTEFHCTTGDGRFIAVAFAPSTFVNRQDLRLRGAMAAVVDARTGATWLLPQRVTLGRRQVRPQEHLYGVLPVLGPDHVLVALGGELGHQQSHR